MRRIVRLAAGSAMAAIALVAGVAANRPATAANASISIADFAFSPASVTVSVGDTVTWTNNDAGIPHTVSSDSGSELASGQLAGGASYQKTFTSAGSYAYHCDIHPSMTGLVIVTAAQATAAATATATPTATPTPAATATGAAATATATATPTLATQPTATPTSASASTPGPTATAAASPTSAPTPPATGEGDGGGGGDSATVVTSGIVAVALVLAVGGAVYALRRRSAARA